jgi:hypothetical protein
MIRFGMGLMEIVEQLTRGFMKTTGKQPGNLEKLKIQQEAIQRLKEMNKVVDMEGRAMDTTKPIIGGTQRGADLKLGIMKATGARPRQVLSEDEIRQKLLKNNEEGIKSLEERMKKNKEYQDLKKSFDDPEKKAMGGRIGYKGGSKGKIVEGLLKALQNKFGKKAATTADKAPIPPKTLERNMFKKADKRLSDKRMLDDDEYQDFLDEVGGADQLEAYDFDGTVGSAKRILKEQKEYMDDMFMEYKKGNLDPVAGDKSPARKRFLEKKLEEMEASGDKRLMTVDEIEELSSFDLGSEMDVAKSLAPKMVERLELKQKYPGITDDLLDKILIDDNMQRKAEVLATMDEAIKMMEKGKGADEIVETFKNVTRTKQADGGIMRSAYAGGGMGRRGFLKLLGGVGAGIAGLKSGLVNIMGKGAGKEVAKEVVQQSTTTPPPYFFKLAEKIKTMGDDVTEVLAYKDRQKVTKYKDYELTEDVETGRQTIQRMKVLDDADAADYYGQPLTEETYMSYKPGKGQMDETMKGKTPPDEYEEGTALLRSDREYAGEVVDESFKISDDVIEEAMSEAPSIKIKKASGGIARMLGE